MKRLLSLALGLCALAGTATAAGVSLVGQIDPSPYLQYVGVWGWTDPATRRNYAFVGNNATGLYIVDATNPGSPVVVAVTTVVPRVDMKTFRNYLYTVDGIGSGVGGILDIASPANPVKVGNYTGGHNIFIDDAGFLYVARPGLRVYDLKPNPLSPALVWERTTPDSHDMCVIADVLYDFDAEAGTRLYDVTNPKAPILRGTITDPNMVYHHNGWPTRDHGYLFITDEFSVHPQADVTVWDIHNLAAPFKVASIADATATVHNCYVVGNMLVMSYYTAGFKVFDVSDPVHPAPVYSYDTSSYSGEGNFDGAWGCYAYAPGNRVYITDRPNGLFIFELTGATPVRGTTPRALSISAWPNPTAGPTHVTYTLARGADVTAAVYDVRGTLVRTLDSGWRNTGARELTWDGTNDDGVAVSSGAYYVRVRTAAGTEARKITLVR